MKTNGVERSCILFTVSVPYTDYPGVVVTTKKRAVEEARRHNCRAHRIEVNGEGGMRETAKRLLMRQQYVISERLVADFTRNGSGVIRNSAEHEAA